MVERIIALACIPALTLSVPSKSEKLTCEVVEQEVQVSSMKTKRGEFLDQIKELEKLEQERLERIRREEEEKRIREEQERIERERKTEEERRKQENKKKTTKNVNRGGSVVSNPSKVRKVTCHITFYYGANNSLQGGFKDKKGKALHSHNEPICAMPSDVPYGSYLVLDSPVRGNNTYKVVDTGGAIKWKGGNSVKVDVFVPEAKSMDWIIKNTKNCTITGTLYYK